MRAGDVAGDREAKTCAAFILVAGVVQPQEPPLGAGEAACSAVGAALANAVFDATGMRLRTIPFTPERVKAALNSKAS